MPILRPCVAPNCREWTSGKNSRCKKHQREREAEKLEQNPWERVYDTIEWQTARAHARQRDGYRCTWTNGERRCALTEETSVLSVHHIYKVEALWREHGSPQFGTYAWRRFVLAASDLNKLATVCARHHIKAETQAVTRAGDSGTRRSKRAGRRRNVPFQDRRTKHERDKRKDWLT